MDNPKISTTITEGQASGHPLRRLELRCKILNNSKFSICILDAWISITTKNGLTIAEGKIFHILHALANLAIIKPGQFGDGVMSIHLPGDVLRSIEERRSGGDLDLLIYSRVLICEVRSENHAITLGQPRETQLGDGILEFHIPQSEWIKHLKMLNWSEIELIELPARNPQTKANIRRALDRFNDASDCYRRGMWSETLMNCRKSFEALVKDTASCDDMGDSLRAINSLISDAQKAERINELIKSLANYLHLGRHEQLPNLIIMPIDAQLALHLTGALLAYFEST